MRRIDAPRAWARKHSNGTIGADNESTEPIDGEDYCVRIVRESDWGLIMRLRRAVELLRNARSEDYARTAVGYVCAAHDALEKGGKE